MITFIKTFLILFVVALISGCSEVKTMSLEEANKQTLKFKVSSFTPPKRTIDDLKEIFNLSEIKNQVDESECKELNGYRKEELLSAVEAMYNNRDSHFFKYRPLVLMQNQIILGDYENLIKYLENIENTIPNSGWSVTKARYNAVLSFLYADMGNTNNAYAYDRKAMQFWRKSGWEDTTRGKLYQNVSKAALAAIDGNLLNEEYYLRKVLEIMDSFQLTTKPYGINRYLIASKIIDNLVLQNRVLEAENFARNIIEMSYDHDKSTIAVVLSSLSKVLFKQNRLDDAQYIARVALEIHRSDCSYKDGHTIASAKNNLISILLANNKLKEIVALYEETQKYFIDNKIRFEQLYGLNKDVLLAKVLLNKKTGFLPSTLGLISNNIETLEDNSILAVIKSNEKKYKESLDLYMKNFLPLLDKVNTKGFTSLEVENRTKLIQKKFLELLVTINKKKINVDINISELIFKIVQYNQNSTVQNALNASSARLATDNQELLSLIRKVQDTQTQLKSILNRLVYFNTLPDSHRNFELIQTMEKRVTNLRLAQRALQDELESRFPKYASLINPKTLSLKQIQNSLKDDESLIVINSTKDGSFVWAIPNKGEVLFNHSSLDKKAITNIVNKLRDSLDPNVVRLDEIPYFDVDLSYKLYMELLDPLKKAWKDSTNLLFVTNGELGKLPMGVLVTKKLDEKYLVKNSLSALDLELRGLNLKKNKSKKINKSKTLLFSGYKNVDWIIKDHSITQLPSVQSLNSLRVIDKKLKPSKLFIGFADPIFSQSENNITNSVVSNALNKRGIFIKRRNTPNIKNKTTANISILPRLPDTADEIISISKSLNIKTKDSLYIQKEANEKNVKTIKLTNYKILAFATHGLVAGDLDGLTQPSLALSNPKITGNKNEDGLLTMGEILSLKLNADLVVLSACNTASSDLKGVESISGLGKAFFYAGAKSLLVTHWPVETTSAKILTSTIFTKQDLDKANALRYSQLQMIDKKIYKDIYSYAHPIFWAPFSLVGDRL